MPVVPLQEAAPGAPSDEWSRSVVRALRAALEQNPYALDPTPPAPGPIRQAAYRAVWMLPTLLPPGKRVADPRVITSRADGSVEMSGVLYDEAPSRVGFNRSGELYRFTVDASGRLVGMASIAELAAPMPYGVSGHYQ